MGKLGETIDKSKKPCGLRNFPSFLFVLGQNIRPMQRRVHSGAFWFLATCDGRNTTEKELIFMA